MPDIKRTMSSKQQQAMGAVTDKNGKQSPAKGFYVQCLMNAIISTAVPESTDPAVDDDNQSDSEYEYEYEEIEVEVDEDYEEEEELVDAVAGKVLISEGQCN